MNVKTLLDQLLQSGQQIARQGRDAAEKRLDVPDAGPQRDAMLSGLGKGALAGGLLTLLLGSRAGRRLGGSALKIGGMAALGGLAYSAYQKWQANSGAVPDPEPAAAPERLAAPQTDRRSLNLVRAMIAAAKADGHVDDAEAEKIKQQMARFDLDDAALRVLRDDVDGPSDPAAIAATSGSVAEAAELYLASLLVIDVDTSSERDYLRRLAAELQLDDALVAQIEAELGGA